VGDGGGSRIDPQDLGLLELLERDGEAGDSFYVLLADVVNGEREDLGDIFALGVGAVRLRGSISK
jgi:hypothetical protein